VSDAKDSLAWMPVLLLAAGVFFLVSGILSDGPDHVGGIVFGVVSLAAAGAILYRRARDARAAQSKDESAKPDTADADR
jgi:hypothetical protein